MTQVFSLIALVGLLLSFVQAAPARPDAQHNGPGPNGAGYIWEPEQGPSLNGSSAFGIVGHQGSRLNGSPLQVLGPSVPGFALEGVELADGTVVAAGAEVAAGYVGHQGPSLNGSSAFGIGGHQGPSLNGAPLQALGYTVRGFAVESVELPDGSSLSR